MLPTKVKTFVPEEDAVPIFLKAFGPFKIIHGTFANVSTLLTTVGF
jgi:hypothetical protein